MNKVFNLTSTFKALSEDDDGVHICGMASTNHADRANDVIEAEAWTKGGLANFEQNPIILFNHNYDKPIGRATGLKVTENGLELRAKISKSAPDHVAQLVKEGILGAFSVGFRVKDADYNKETDGLKIKDAELFEVSVVSVPCNQAATFSLAKSFDSQEEYEDFKKTFTSVDLAGQCLAKDEDSSVASHTPDGTQEVQKEIKMSEENKTPEIDLAAFAKQVADETAAKIAMQQAEQKAAAEKAAVEAEEKAQAAAEAKTQQEEKVKSAVAVGVSSGAEALMQDVEAKLKEKDAKIDEVIKQFASQLSEKEEEITKMRESKRVFSANRTSSEDLSPFAKELMYGHILGVMLNKGWNTSYGKNVLSKAGVTYPNDGGTEQAGDTEFPNIATTVSQAIEKEVMNELRLAQAFRQIQMPARTMVMPIQTDTNLASFSNGITAGTPTLENRTQVAGNTYEPSQVVLQAHRLISHTHLDNYIEEEILVSLMPMLIESIARSHARAVDNMILNGEAGKVNGLEFFATASSGGSVDLDGATIATGNSATLTAELLLDARKDMGKYGLNPSDVTYVVSQKYYYDLIADPAFADITDVGSDVATKITGSIGAVYGSPVLISDNFESDAAGGSVAYAVANRNYAIPRLRGVTVEQDYEVGNQRRVVVATQSLGFAELVADAAGDRSCVKVVTTA